MIELEKVKNGLRQCINAHVAGCDGCPYFGKSTKDFGCQSHLPIDALAFIEDKFEKDMNKLRIENAELLQRILQLEKDLEKERAYNYAIVTVIKNKYST